MNEPDDRGMPPLPRSESHQGDDPDPAGVSTGGTAGDEPGQVRGTRRWLALEISVLLTFLAVVHVIFLLDLVVARGDTEFLETTLAGVVAGQFTDGPSRIYGPYTPTNPRVLIQAPLYYRLSGLLAWPLAGGFGPLNAAFIAGRFVSLASFAVLLYVVFRLAQLDGGSRRAGTCSVALVLTSWLFGTYPVTVRPDVPGVLLQTLGTYLVLRVALGDARPGWSLSWAYVAFALAACVKQHDLGAAAVSTLVLLYSWTRRRSLRRAIERAWLLGLVIVVCYYLAEEVFTRGWMSEQVFRVPAALRLLQPPDLRPVFGQALMLCERSATLLGFALGCLVAVPGAFVRGRLGRLLWAYFLMELLLVGLLTFRNDGSWVNYGLQAVVFGCILVGRALAHAVNPSIRWWRVVPLSLLAASVACVNLAEGYSLARRRISDEQALNALIHDRRLAPWEPARVYFCTLPSFNRLCGRAGWVHDEFLYGKFERLRAVPPRSPWLRAGLTDGTIRLVIVPSDPPLPMAVDPPVPPGLHESLPDLGYDFVMWVDRLAVWEHRRTARPAAATDRGGPAHGRSTSR